MRNYIINILELEYHNLNLWYCICFMCGIMTYFCAKEDFSYSTIIVSIAIFGIFLYLKYNFILCRFIFFLLVFFSFGLLVGKLKVSRTHISQMREKEVISKIDGTIESIKPNVYGAELVLTNVKIHKFGEDLHKIKINISKKRNRELSIGDKISLLAKLYSPKINILPNSYDFGFYSYLAGISGNGYAMSMVELSHSSSEESLIHNLRNTIYKYLISNLGDKKGNFAAAIILGETKAIDKELMRDMRQSGISHILCVSGLHLTLVASIIFISTRFLLNLFDYIAFNYDIKTISAICALFGSYGYLELSNMQIAATRAFIMTAIFICSIIFGRGSEPIRSLAIACFVILVFDPEYIFHPSFQLSFISVLSLIAGYEFFIRHKHVLGRTEGIFGSVKLYVFSNIYSSFLASIITAPVVINQFYIFSTYSILVNLIAVPIMSFFLMPLSIIAVIFMKFSIATWILNLLGFFINIIINVAHYANSLKNSVYYFGYITHSSILIFLFGFFWICLWKSSWRLVGIVIMLFGFILMFYSKKPDVMIDYQLKTIAVKNNKQELEIYSNDKFFSKFNRIYWSNWFGQEDANMYHHNGYIYGKYSLFVHEKHNKFTECPENVDIYVNMLDCSTKCKGGKLTIDNELFRKSVVILIFCDQKQCKININDNTRFK